MFHRSPRPTPARAVIAHIEVDGHDRPVELDTAAGEFQVRVGDDVAFVTYRRQGTMLVLLHTEVPRAFRGKGVGDALARAVLGYAKAEGLTVRVECQFIARFIDRHPEWKPVVDPRVR